MLRIIAVAIVLVGIMVGIKNGHVLQRLDLTGSCSAVAAPSGQTGDWRACRPGRLAGQPSLVRNSCTQQATSGDIVYWRCPTSVASSPVRP